MYKLNKYIAFIFILTFCILQACSDVSTTPEQEKTEEKTVIKVSDYPLEIGNVWVYSIINMKNGSDIGTVTVIASKSDFEGNPPREPGRQNKYQIYLRELLHIKDNSVNQDDFASNVFKTMPYLSFYGDTLRSSSESQISPNTDFLVFPLTIGKSWKSVERNRQTPTKPFSVNFMVINKVVKSLNEEVYYGKFRNVMRIQRNFYVSEQSTFYEEILDIYPGIGIISRRIRRVSNGTVNFDYKFDLVNCVL